MKKLLVFILVVGILFFVGKNTIAKMVISGGVRAVTGLELEMEKMDVGVLNTLIAIQDLKVLNPSGFPEKVMADLPEVMIDYDPGAFFRGRIHLEALRLHLKEFVVVKNKEGKLNIDAFKARRPQRQRKLPLERKAEGKTSRIQIDALELHVGKVISKDYSKGTPITVREFDVNIHERYEDVQDPVALGRLIVSRTLIKTAIARITDLDLEDIEIKITDTVVKYTGKVTKTAETTKELGKEVGREVVGTAKGVAESAKEVAEETVDTLKKIFPLGE